MALTYGRKTSWPRATRLFLLSVVWIGSCGGQASSNDSASDAPIGTGGEASASGAAAPGSGGETEATGGAKVTGGAAATGGAGASSGGNASSGGALVGGGGIPGLPPRDFCGDASECDVIVRGCCAPCEPAPIDAFEAINIAHSTLRPECDVLCGACEDEERQPTSHYYIATCEEQTCQVRDLRETEYTECEVDDDCFLHRGTECCESCVDEHALALSSMEFLPRCGGALCIPCPALPSHWIAQCRDRRCVVSTLLL